MKRHPYLRPGAVSAGEKHWQKGEWEESRRRCTHQPPRMRWKAAIVCDVCGAGNLNIHMGVIGLLLAIYFLLFRLLCLELRNLVESNVCLAILSCAPRSDGWGDHASRSQAQEKAWMGNMWVDTLMWLLISCCHYGMHSAGQTISWRYLTKVNPVMDGGARKESRPCIGRIIKGSALKYPRSIRWNG